MGEAKRRKFNGYVPSHLPRPDDRMINQFAAQYSDAYNNTCGDDNTRTIFANEVQQLITLAFKREGWNAFKSTRESAPAHEAGHVVILGLYGIHAKYCCLETRHVEDLQITEWGGYTKQVGQPLIVAQHTTPENDWRQAANLISG
jgi:hypothetical protein